MKRRKMLKMESIHKQLEDSEQQTRRESPDKYKTDEVVWLWHLCALIGATSVIANLYMTCRIKKTCISFGALTQGGEGRISLSISSDFSSVWIILTDCQDNGLVHRVCALNDAAGGETANSKYQHGTEQSKPRYTTFFIRGTKENRLNAKPAHQHALK